jgi:phosphomannomutase
MGIVKRQKKLVIFDLDGTLAESKSALDPEMAVLLRELLGVARVAVISGGNWPQFEQQLLAGIGPGPHLEKLSLLPTCGTKFYDYVGGAWKVRYADEFSAADKKKIIDALDEVVKSAGLDKEQSWGERIEDRGSQITLSALGQKAPLEAKSKWDPDFKKRQVMKLRLDVTIPEFSVRLGGSTSIDVTRPGIDKAYGIKKLEEILGITIPEMLFFGDALFPGGNDYPAKEVGVTSIRVRDPEETKHCIEAVVACLGAQ